MNAGAFDQDLGWCVSTVVAIQLQSAFDGAGCEASGVGGDYGCGVTECFTPTETDLRVAVTAWVSDPAAVEAANGPIEQWDTRNVANMAYLFCVRDETMDGDVEFDGCSLTDTALNADLSRWNVGSVTAFEGMSKSSVKIRAFRGTRGTPQVLQRPRV